MKELKLSEDLPEEVVKKAFSDLEEHLIEKHGEIPDTLSLIPSGNVITVNNSDRLFGEAENIVSTSIYDWIMDNYQDLSEEDRDEYHPANSVDYYTV
jgi:hypothetical protein